MNSKKWALATVLSVMSTLAAVPSWAAFATVSKSTVNASAVLSATGQVAMSVIIKNVSNNATAASIGWTVALPASWDVADQYIQLDSTITSATGGVQIYTDNKAADATPIASTGVCAGLVDNTDTTKVLSLAWTVKDVTTNTIVAAGPFDTVSNSGDSSWLYFKDKSAAPNPAVMGEDYVTVKNTLGIHFATQAIPATGYGATTSPDIIYLEANFANALTPRTYSGKIRLEAFTL